MHIAFGVKASFFFLLKQPKTSIFSQLKTINLQGSSFFSTKKQKGILVKMGGRPSLSLNLKNT